MKRRLENPENRTTRVKRRIISKTLNTMDRLSEDVILYTLLFLQQHEVWKIQPTCQTFRKAWLRRGRKLAPLPATELPHRNAAYFRYRELLFNYLTAIHAGHKLKEITLWAAFYICDKYYYSDFRESVVDFAEFEVVGITALYIASRFLEPPAGVPIVSSLCSYDHCPRDILQMEKVMYNRLGCDIMPKQNIYSFSCKLLRVATRNIASVPLCEKLADLTMFIIEMYHLGCTDHGLWHLPFQKDVEYFVAACLQAALKLLKIQDIHREELIGYGPNARVAYLSALRQLNWTQDLIEASGGFVKRELRHLYKRIREEVMCNDWSREEVIFKYECKETNIPKYFTT